MTFYNIIFAIVFYGAVRQLLISIQACEWTVALSVLALVLLIFNDTITTSHYCDSSAANENRSYSEKMKLLDLLGFCLIVGALVGLSPNDNFLVESKDTHQLVPGSAICVFWAFVAAYWLEAIFWTVCWNTNAAARDRWLSWQPWALFGLLVACAAATCFFDEAQSSLQFWSALVSLAGVLVYLIWRYWGKPSGSSASALP